MGRLNRTQTFLTVFDVGKQAERSICFSLGVAKRSTVWIFLPLGTFFAPSGEKLHTPHMRNVRSLEGDAFLPGLSGVKVPMLSLPPHGRAAPQLGLVNQLPWRISHITEFSGYGCLSFAIVRPDPKTGTEAGTVKRKTGHLGQSSPCFLFIAVPLFRLQKLSDARR